MAQVFAGSEPQFQSWSLTTAGVPTVLPTVVPPTNSTTHRDTQPTFGIYSYAGLNSGYLPYNCPTFPGSFGVPLVFPNPITPFFQSTVSTPTVTNLPIIPKTIFVGNLATTVSPQLLEQVFSRFGSVQQVKYVKAKHFAFITYSDPKDATWAKTNSHGAILEGRPMRVSWGKEGLAKGQCPTVDDEDELPRMSRNPVDTSPIISSVTVPSLVPANYVPNSNSFTEVEIKEGNSTLFIGNLAPAITSQTLQAIFNQFGHVKVCF
eukprot:TRINITY_DN73_c0_g1_i1.p1 TRINITY_DN73_c0_g1~~TRINITY_DN73_c0_g1_i1.p1  ORF type:complete len:263 (-),score=34.06 TRINITY_DN73_c0_g1_i1:916-1704(-)